jgi:hypothetical protein
MLVEIASGFALAMTYLLNRINFLGRRKRELNPKTHYSKD